MSPAAVLTARRRIGNGVAMMTVQNGQRKRRSLAALNIGVAISRLAAHGAYRRLGASVAAWRRQRLSTAIARRK
jgi:hypothetical protein